MIDRATLGSEDTANGTFGAIQAEQLNIYATELSKLYTLLRSLSGEVLQLEERLRAKGSQIEELLQLLSAAYTCSELLNLNNFPDSSRLGVTERLHQLLVRCLDYLRKERTGIRAYGQTDLGLAALLKQELRTLAARNGWLVEVDTEEVKPSPLAETAAYLTVREALQRAAQHWRVKRVALYMRPRDNMFAINLAVYFSDKQPQEVIEEDTTDVLLTRLYGRLAGGTCKWRRCEDASGAAMELVLPLNTTS